nr:hypothetical protein [Tanacetum cinerariifolium]
MSQFEPHVITSKAKKASRNHDPLALVANSQASLSYSHLRKPYYVTHPSSVIDNDDNYHGEIQGDAQEDKLSTAMMLLARAITQCYSTPTNNHLRTSSNTRNQAVIQYGHVDIESNNSIDEYEQNVKRVPRIESSLGKTNIQCYNCNVKGHYAKECLKPKVCDAKYFREQMLLATKDEAGVRLDEEENDFMLDNSYEDNMLEELNAAVNVSQIDMINGLLSKSDHEQRDHEKLKTIIHTSVDDQIDYVIIFDDPYVDNNSGQAEHDTNAHDQPFHDFESLIQNVQREAKNQRKLNIELKKKKMLLQRELEACKEWVKEFENKHDKF